MCAQTHELGDAAQRCLLAQWGKPRLETTDEEGQWVNLDSINHASVDKLFRGDLPRYFPRLTAKSKNDCTCLLVWLQVGRQ